VVTPAVAAQLREFLRGAATEGGTGEEAQLVNYTVLGKTGTAVRFENGRYVHGTYTASFAALFPADDPQLVVIVKIDNPRGKYYGGLTAAPVTRTMLQQALASRRIAIEHTRLPSRDQGAVQESLSRNPEPTPTRVVLSWPYQVTDTLPRERPIPSVDGRPVREAILALHRSGFRVSLKGLGRVSRTAPTAGETANVGTMVVVWTE
jgi:hypothetical protein